MTSQYLPQKKITAVISSIGISLPENILTNFDLEKMVETTNEWILTRTGIEERRIAKTDEHTSTLAVQAARDALFRRGIDASSVDLIIVTTMTPDYLCPSTACLVQGELQASQAAAFDLQAACSGFLYGLQTAKAFVESGIYKKILLISSEKNSAFVDYTDRNTCVLFGDGAGACLIEPSTSPDLPNLTFAIRSVELGADGSLSDLIVIPAGGSRHPGSHESIENKLHAIKMNGKEVFKHAVRRMELAAKSCLETEQLEEKNLRWLVPHQANMRIIDALAKRFDIPSDRVATTIKQYANTSASTIPIALYDILKKGAVEPHDLFLLVAFGGGLTWGASILEALSH